jgi:hypothetical protein
MTSGAIGGGQVGGAGQWNAAHELVQQYETDTTAAWIHAVLHKIEGDNDNILANQSAKITPGRFLIWLRDDQIHFLASGLEMIGQRSIFPLGVHRSQRGVMLNWTRLNQNFETMHRTQAIIPFPIRAAVEFVARGASICGVDEAVQDQR